MVGKITPIFIEDRAILDIKVFLDLKGRLSSTGKSMILATTSGFMRFGDKKEDGYSFSLTVIKKKKGG